MSRTLLLGLRLAVSGGPEGLVRLVFVAVGVGLGVAMLLLSLTAPHAMFYEGGLAVLAVVAAAALRADVGPHAVGIWLLALAQVFRPYLPLPPLMVVMILALLMSVEALRAHRTLHS